ncbi:MAG: transposase, partial [Tannerellaceae bacterium]|nr:transposase [Tannerellaceae bacterium]
MYLTEGLLFYIRRILFGRSSERYVKEDPNQLRLDFGGEDSFPEEAQSALEAAKETITYEREKNKENPGKPVRQPLPAELERREEIIEPDPIPEGSKRMGVTLSPATVNGWFSASIDL